MTPIEFPASVGGWPNIQTIAGYLDDTAACNSDKAMASTARAAIAKATT